MKTVSKLCSHDDSSDVERVEENKKKCQILHGNNDQHYLILNLIR